MNSSFAKFVDVLSAPQALHEGAALTMGEESQGRKPVRLTKAIAPPSRWRIVGWLQAQWHGMSFTQLRAAYHAQQSARNSFILGLRSTYGVPIANEAVKSLRTRSALIMAEGKQALELAKRIQLERYKASFPTRVQEALSDAIRALPGSNFGGAGHRPERYHLTASVVSSLAKRLAGEPPPTPEMSETDLQPWATKAATQYVEWLDEMKLSPGGLSGLLAVADLRGLDLATTKNELVAQTGLDGVELEGYLHYIASVVRPSRWTEDLLHTRHVFRHLYRAEGMTPHHLDLILSFAGTASTPQRAKDVARALARPGEHAGFFERSGFIKGSRHFAPYAKLDATRLVEQVVNDAGVTLGSEMLQNLETTALETDEVQLAGSDKPRAVSVSSIMKRDATRSTFVINGAVLARSPEEAFVASYLQSLPADQDPLGLGEFLSRFLNQNNLNAINTTFLLKTFNVNAVYTGTEIRHEAWQRRDGNWSVRSSFFCTSDKVMHFRDGPGVEEEFPMTRLCTITYDIAVSRKPEDLPYRLTSMTASLAFIADPLGPTHSS